MVLIPAPSDQFVEKVKEQMRFEEIQNFEPDEIERVFEYVIQSQACTRVVNYLVNYENFTIDQLYSNHKEYKKYAVSYRIPFNGDVLTKKIIYSKRSASKLFDDMKELIGGCFGLTISIIPEKHNV